MAKPKIPKEYQDFIYEFMKSMQEETSALPTMRSLLDFLRVIGSVEEERGAWAEFLEKVRDGCQEMIELSQAIDTQDRGREHVELYSTGMQRVVEVFAVIGDRSQWWEPEP